MRSNRLSYGPAQGREGPGDVEQDTGWPTATGNRLLVGLLQGDFDAADEVGGHVVDHRPDGGEGGDEQDVQRAEECGVAEDAGGGEPVSGVDGAAPALVVRSQVADRA